MKPLFPLLIIATLLLTSCKKEQPAGTPAPPIAGFGNLSEAVVVDSFLDVQLLLNKPVETPVEVEVTVSGDAVPGTDFEIEGGNRFLLQPGMLNGSLRIRVPKNEDSEQLDRSIHLRLSPTDDLQIAESRDTLTIEFTLGGTVDLSIWASNITFSQLWGYTSFGVKPVPGGRTNEFFAFAYASRTTPDVIGFGHPNPDK